MVALREVIHLAVEAFLQRHLESGLDDEPERLGDVLRHAARFEERLVAAMLEFGERQLVFARVIGDRRGFVDLEPDVAAAPARAIDHRTFALAEFLGDLEVGVLRVLELDRRGSRVDVPGLGQHHPLVGEPAAHRDDLRDAQPGVLELRFMLFTDTRSNGRFVRPSARDSFHTP